MPDDALVIDRVTKAYRRTLAVDDLTLAVRAGTIFGLLGPNGSGKTTTLRMVLGILLPDSGTIRVLGATPGEVVREQVGYLPEERGLYPKMRVLDHLVFLGELHRLSRATARERARVRLAGHEASEWETRKVEELSKGQQQAIQLIGALIHDPPLVILDEPFSGLDPVNVERLQGTIRRLRDEGKTVLLSTHRMDQVERLCDEITLISRGREVLSGPLRQVKARFGRDAVRLVMEDGIAPDLPESLVRGIERTGDGVLLRLAQGADPQDVLRRALAAGRVVRFERVEPTLEEIFVEAVQAR